MSEFDDELAAAVERLRKQADKESRPRYKIGYRSTESIRLYCRPSNPKLLDIYISYDLVDQLWRWRDWAKENKPMPSWVRDTLRAEFVRFNDVGVPGCLLRLESMAVLRQRGLIMRQPKKQWRYVVTATTKRLGLKPGIPSPRKLEYLPWPEQKGFILIFEPEDMLETTELTDVQMLRGLVDDKENEE